MTTSTISQRVIAGAALLVLGAVTSSCSMQKQTAPDPTGPSEFGLSVTLTATPDQIIQDGVSQTTAAVVVRNESGKAVSGMAIRWAAVLSDGTYVEPGSAVTTTDSNGRTSTTITAPPAPAALPASPITLGISATPIGTDLGNQSPRIVTVRLIAPTGTLPTNRLPAPAFTIVPAVTNIGQSVTFDASTTYDEGSPCLNRCKYQWDFGDFKTDSGLTTSHKYPLPGSYTVTLTVTDDRGGVASTSRSVTVNGPAPPLAQFTSAPASPFAGTAVTFNATTSTVGAGATIVLYTWEFGDGTPAVTTTIPAVQNTYALPGTYIVTLTVTDSLERTNTKVSTVTIQ